MYDDRDLPTDMLLALMGPTEPKEHCAEEAWTNLTQRPNYKIGTCTREKGHPPDYHVDCHSGSKWKVKVADSTIYV